MNNSPTHRIAARRRMLGVTLLELMAVIMVIGILGMIAIPSYRQYTTRAYRAEAKAFLLQVQTNQERFYLQQRRYGSVAELQAANLLSANARSERGVYQLDITGENQTGYTARATPVSGGTVDMTTDAQCATFSITAQGVRTATGTDAANCW